MLIFIGNVAYLASRIDVAADPAQVDDTEITPMITDTTRQLFPGLACSVKRMTFEDRSFVGQLTILVVVVWPCSVDGPQYEAYQPLGELFSQ